jgi:hypothetical protein
VDPASSRKWYYAQFLGRCVGLNFATAVGFDMRAQSSFDRWSSVFVPGRPLPDQDVRTERRSTAPQAQIERRGAARSKRVGAV